MRTIITIAALIICIILPTNELLADKEVKTYEEGAAGWFRYTKTWPVAQEARRRLRQTEARR